MSLEEDIHSILDDWLEWSEKITKFAQKESATHPLLKKLLGDLEKRGDLPYPHG